VDDLDDRYVFNVWAVEPSHRTGSSMEGTVQFSWKAVYCRAALRNLGGFYDTKEAALAAVRELTKDNVPF
jgi:hypothetical protein